MWVPILRNFCTRTVPKSLQLLNFTVVSTIPTVHILSFLVLFMFLMFISVVRTGYYRTVGLARETRQHYELPGGYPNHYTLDCRNLNFLLFFLSPSPFLCLSLSVFVSFLFWENVILFFHMSRDLNCHVTFWFLPHLKVKLQ